MWRIFIVLGLLTKFTSCTQPAIEFDLNKALSVRTICTAAEEAKLSQPCMDQLQESCMNRTILTLMIDAQSKFPYSGLYVARRWDLGNFDECVKINHKYNGNETILGKYCTNGLILTGLTDIAGHSDTFKLATCIPNKCTANDYNNIFQVIYSNKFNGYFTDDLCSTREPIKFTTPAIVILAVFGIIIFLMVCSTIYDYKIYCNGETSSNKAAIAFSVLTNGRNILKTSKPNKNQIGMVSGLRFITTLWVVLSHTSHLWAVAPVMNLIDLEQLSKNWYSFYTCATIAAVDTFFFISGCLLAFNYLKHKEKSLQGQVQGIPRFYLHRYLRIAPSVYMIYFVMVYLLEYMGKGPLAQIGCRKAKYGCEPGRRWAFFLFLENIYHDRYCLFHTWYLSVDMQLYVLSPLILIPLAIRLKNGAFKSSMICLFVFYVVLFVASLTLEILLKDHDNFTDLYPRALIYIPGVMLGAYLREKRNEPFLLDRFRKRTKTIVNLLVWLLALFVMAVCCYGGIYIYFIVVMHPSVWMILMKPLWAVSLCWIIYACDHGYGGVANWIFTRPIMQTGAKLSYNMYIVHILPIFLHYNRIRTKVYVSDLNLNVMFWAFFMATTLLSYFWTLAFEAPIGVLEKCVFDAPVRNFKMSLDPVENPARNEPPENHHRNDNETESKL